MALSSSESELLTKTCTNMNIAANTCREVLEMLRSLGNTGVVDIATHNNAEAPHADATNLVHFDSSGNMVLGTYGSCAPTIWSTYYPFMIRYSNKGYNILHLHETKGSSGFADYSQRSAITDANGELVDSTDLSSIFGTSTRVANRIVLYAHLKYNSQDQQTSVGLSHVINETDSHLLFSSYGANFSSYANRIVFAYDRIAPETGSTVTLGISDSPFDGVYSRTAVTVTSDRREKSGISAIGSEAVDFVKALRPVQYTVKNGRQTIVEADESGKPVSVETAPGTRRHWGLVAQEVQEALVSAGYDPSDCAVWSLADKNDPDSRQALRYEELIAPMIKVIQQQQERIEALERKVA